VFIQKIITSGIQQPVEVSQDVSMRIPLYVHIVFKYRVIWINKNILVHLPKCHVRFCQKESLAIRLTTCFHIFSYISYIHVKTMFDSPLLRFVLSWFHALFNVTLYFNLFTYSGVQCDFHINGWSYSICFCV
jgi:hypothetical protein